MNKKIIAISVLIAILFVSAIAGTIIYCNGVINDGNSKIASLNGQIANLDSKVSNLKGQVANLSSQIINLYGSANLVTALGVTEVPYNSPNNFPSPLLYNHLFIAGSVTNTGTGTAYNAGLHVVAYEANGKVEVNMTVPLVGNVNVTGGEITDFAPVFGTDAATQIYGNDSLQLGNLYGGQTVSISLGIFHEGTVTNWTITPVWTPTATPTLTPTATPTPFPTVTTVITSVTFNNATYDFGNGGQSESIPDTSMVLGTNYTLVIKVTDYETLNQGVTPGMASCGESISGTNGIISFTPPNNEPGVLPVLPSGNSLILTWNVEALSVGAANPVITIMPVANGYSFQNATLSFRVTVNS
jgi:hypothetical protein